MLGAYLHRERHIDTENRGHTHTHTHTDSEEHAEIPALLNDIVHLCLLIQSCVLGALV